MDGRIVRPAAHRTDRTDAPRGLPRPSTPREHAAPAAHGRDRLSAYRPNDRQALHRARLAGRRRAIDGFVEPTWASVQARRTNFAAWQDDRLVLDSTRALADNPHVALTHLREAGGR
ncbi:hypothetical protein F0L68_23325 [Solihabitans fulvus]|uniref:Uncharacterized protein n=1 Tax=Solihabitans fulvus TaxID=1892852 RepID=A0A5B2X694_9PSEU|nr:hypothetical protein F0L68_23325 [Solihabitans fulvus]